MICSHLSALEIKPDPSIDRAISVIDTYFPCNQHKMGIVYVGTEQKTELEVLNNTAGSQRYYDVCVYVYDCHVQFLMTMSSPVSLTQPPDDVYLGGQLPGPDGDMSWIWESAIGTCYFYVNIMMVDRIVFHVATELPTAEENINNKKRLIGNDYVAIIYSDNPETPAMDIIVVRTLCDDDGDDQGQFSWVQIIVHPLPSSTYNNVTVRLRRTGAIGVPESLCRCGPLSLDQWSVVSDKALPHLVRLTAMNADVCIDVSVCMYVMCSLYVRYIVKAVHTDYHGRCVMRNCYVSRTSTALCQHLSALCQHRQRLL